MSPKMKRELLLALDVMLNDKPDFTGKHYRGQVYRYNRCLARVQAKARGSWWDLVFIGTHGNYPKDTPLRAGTIRYDPGFLWIMERVGEQELYDANDWDRNVIGGPLTIHALRAAVREELNKLQVA